MAKSVYDQHLFTPQTNEACSMISDILGTLGCSPEQLGAIGLQLAAIVAVTSPEVHSPETHLEALKELTIALAHAGAIASQVQLHTMPEADTIGAAQGSC